MLGGLTLLLCRSNSQQGHRKDGLWFLQRQRIAHASEWLRRKKALSLGTIQVLLTIAGNHDFPTAPMKTETGQEVHGGPTPWVPQAH